MASATLRDLAIGYHEAGWHPVELPARAKALPPTGRTGYGGRDMTADEIAAADWAGNLGIRMPDDVIGLDVDVYHGGDRTLAELLARCGPLPPTWISHNGRNDGSGIRYYRVPPGLAWVAGVAGIEVIQRHHRYGVAPPSMHPDGRPYGWVDQSEGPTDALPVVEDLPELPWAWIAELSRALAADVAGNGQASHAVDPDGLEAFLNAHTQADQPSYISTIAVHFTDRWQQGYSRHDTMQHCLTWAMECVAAGVASARPTLTQFEQLWLRAVASDPRRAELRSARRTTEFEAMLRHAVGKAGAKSQAELHKIHDDIAGVPMRPAPPEAPQGPQGATGAELVALVPVITFRDLPDPFRVPTITWHAENLLCRETHGELAGAEKSLKSYLGLFLDVGLAAGIDVLGYFPVPERQRVLALIGEGGEGPFLRRVAEVCASYGIAPADLQGWFRYTTDHASAGSNRFLDGIRHELETFGPALVHADPWYSYQPAGTESNQLTSVGATLEVVGETCRAGDATLLLNHHFNRGVNGGLRQITGAGHAEWVDSWVLSRHREPPNLTAGVYKLRVDVGSRQWGGGAYDIDLTMTPPLGVPRWRVRPYVEDAEGHDPLADYRLEVLRTGRRLKQPQKKTVWVESSKGNAQKLRAAFDELVALDLIIPGTVPNTFKLAT